MRLGLRLEPNMWVEARLGGALVRVDVPMPWPRAPIELRVPASGLLRVIAYDDKEQPRRDVQSVNLQWANAMAGLDGDVEPSGATFRVALGCRFDVSVRLKGTAGELRESVPGPVRAGELVVCEVRATQGPPTVTLRVLGLDGKPLVRTQVGVVFLSDQFARGDDAMTDGDGFLRILLDDEKRNATELFLVHREPDRRNNTVLYQGATRVPLPSAWTAGENTLADAALREEPIVAAGVVVDDTGKPLPKAVVFQEMSWRRGSTRFSGSMFHSEVRTDAEGRFTLRDLGAADSVTVNARGPAGHELAMVEVATGTADVRIVLHRQGRVRLTLFDVPKADHRLLTGFLVAAGEVPKGNGHEVKADTFLTARAGTYDLVLRLHAESPDLVRIPGIVIESGKDTVESRLELLDCSPFAKGVTITTVSADGAPLANQQVTCMLQVGRRRVGFGGTTDASGRCFLFAPAAGVQVSVGGPQLSDFRSQAKFRRVKIDAVTTDQRIEMKPQMAVRLRPATDAVLPASARVSWLTAGGNPLAMFLTNAGMGGGTVQADGSVTFAFDEPGEHTLEMVVLETVDGRTEQHRFVWGKIDVQDVVDEQVFPLALAKEDAERLVELRVRLQAK
jgi:hypothetical protein